MFGADILYFLIFHALEVSCACQNSIYAVIDVGSTDCIYCLTFFRLIHDIWPQMCIYMYMVRLLRYR